MNGVAPVWLVSEGRVLAAAQRTLTRAARRHGLIGIENLDQPLVITPCNWVHTFGMKTTIDVVYLNAGNVVIDIDSMKPRRIGPYTRYAVTVIEAASGSVTRWNIGIGDTVEVRNVEQ